MKALKSYLPPILLFIAAAGIYLGRSLYQAKEIVPWRLDPPAAMAEARAKSKPALLYFTAAWCEPCQSLKHTTWADSAVAKALAGYVPIEIDVDQFHDLDQQYPSDGIPHLVVIDGNGKVLRDISGAMDSKEFLDWLSGKMVAEDGMTDSPATHPALGVSAASAPSTSEPTSQTSQ